MQYSDIESAQSLIDGNEKRSYKFKTWHLLIGAIILFPYISIFVLFAKVGENTTKV